MTTMYSDFDEFSPKRSLGVSAIGLFFAIIGGLGTLNHLYRGFQTLTHMGEIPMNMGLVMGVVCLNILLNALLCGAGVGVYMRKELGRKILLGYLGLGMLIGIFGLGIAAISMLIVGSTVGTMGSIMGMMLVGYTVFLGLNGLLIRKLISFETKMEFQPELGGFDGDLDGDMVSVFS